MSFETGHKKFGGRKKGTPNKKTGDLIASLEKCNLDPVSRIADLLPQLDPEKQINTLLNMMQYLYPKRKPIDPLPPNNLFDPFNIFDNNVEE